MDVFIAGSGAWATALAIRLSDNGHRAVLWTRSGEKASLIRKSGENPALPGVPLPDTISVTCDPAQAEGARVLLYAVASEALRRTAALFGPLPAPDGFCISAVKGLEAGSRLRMSQIIAEYAPDRILIEPSGVGKLSDVIGAVRKVTSDDVQLGNFVTVADATKCKMYMKNFGEFYNNQIETANTIILSRTDGMKEEKLDQCVAMIREHNKDAVIVTTPWPELTGEQLMEAMEQRSTIAVELAKLEEEAHHHHHDHDDDDDEECDDPDCSCHHHHHDDDNDDEHEHHHHHHDHDDEDECDDPDCSCHHHHDDDDEDEHEHHHHHHHHHGHDADEVFISWGEETHKKFTKAEIEHILQALEDAETYGIILRAKGYVANAEGEKWIHFDYVPGEPDIRDGGAMVTGRICVIGSKLNEEAVAKLFGVEKQ